MSWHRISRIPAVRALPIMLSDSTVSTSCGNSVIISILILKNPFFGGGSVRHSLDKLYENRVILLGRNPLYEFSDAGDHEFSSGRLLYDVNVASCG